MAYNPGASGAAIIAVMGLSIFNVGALIAILVAGDFITTAIVAGAIATLTIVIAWQMWQRDRRQLSEFIDAVALDDTSHQFVVSKFVGGGTLADALNGAMQRLGRQRAALVTESRLNAAFLESTPVAILTIAPDGMVRLVNRAARKLLHTTERLPLGQLADFGDVFFNALRREKQPLSLVIPLAVEGVEQAVLLTSSEVVNEGSVIRIVALQPIQVPLDQAEVANQRNLLRVLTHEIMNSITPVTSLAQTSVDLLNRLDRNIDEIDRAASAVGTLADRAESIMRFVQNYRMLSAPLQVDRQEFLVSEWAQDLSRLVRADRSLGIEHFEWSVDPPAFRINADPGLLTQLALNLLRNSAEAAGTAARIALFAERLSTGRARLAVDDNGPGVPSAYQDDVFLPFFSTKAGGSGVGLALARQIALAHGGSISIGTSSLGGASVSVIL